MRLVCREEETSEAFQAGMLEALLAVGIRPDVVVGTSIGAANAAFLAADPSVEGARALSDVWRAVRSKGVFPISPLTTVRACAAKFQMRCVLPMTVRKSHVVTMGCHR